MQSNTQPRSASDRLIVALDMPTVEGAQTLVSRLGSAVSTYKVGMELAYCGGLDLVGRLKDQGKSIFLDLKLHDIPTTVERAVRQVARLGATFLSVHAYPQTMRAAVAGREDSPLKLLGVSVMTSYDDADLAEAGYAQDVASTVERRALQAKEAALDGLVLSAREAARIRPIVGAEMSLVTPGIRLETGSTHDQKRVLTPEDAIRAGADYLVIGRPITAAHDPVKVVHEILHRMDKA